jgi:hypothetical protein
MTRVMLIPGLPLRENNGTSYGSARPGLLTLTTGIGGTIWPRGFFAKAQWIPGHTLVMLSEDYGRCPMDCPIPKTTPT